MDLCLDIFSFFLSRFHRACFRNHLHSTSPEERLQSQGHRSHDGFWTKFPFVISRIGKYSHSRVEFLSSARHGTCAIHPWLNNQRCDRRWMESCFDRVLQKQGSTIVCESRRADVWYHVKELNSWGIAIVNWRSQEQLSCIEWMVKVISQRSNWNIYRPI